MVNETGIFNKTAGALNDVFSSIISRFVVAVVIILLGFIVGKLLGKLVQRLLHEIKLNKLVKNLFGLRMSLEEFIGIIVTFACYMTGILLGLVQIGITATVLHVLLFLVALFVLMTIYVEIVDFVPNFIAGIYIHRKKFMKEGETIKIGNVTGKIMVINLTETLLETKDKDQLYIPNRVLRNKVIRKKA